MPVVGLIRTALVVFAIAVLAFVALVVFATLRRTGLCRAAPGGSFAHYCCSLCHYLSGSNALTERLRAEMLFLVSMERSALFERFVLDKRQANTL